MKAFLDTSVLVAVFLGDHERHGSSLSLFLKFSRTEACAGVHSLAEVYSTVTGLPGRRRVAPDQALLFLQTLRERLTLISLSENEYWGALKQISEAGISGGAVYDFLLARCALKAKAQAIYTWNLRDFERLGPEVAGLVRTP